MQQLERPATGSTGRFPPPSADPARRALWLTLMPVPDVIHPPRPGLFSLHARHVPTAGREDRSAA